MCCVLCAMCCVLCVLCLLCLLCAVCAVCCVCVCVVCVVHVLQYVVRVVCVLCACCVCGACDRRCWSIWRILWTKSVASMCMHQTYMCACVCVCMHSRAVDLLCACSSRVGDCGERLWRAIADGRRGVDAGAGDVSPGTNLDVVSSQRLGWCPTPPPPSFTPSLPSM